MIGVGWDKVAQTAQKRKISFAECLLFDYLGRQELSFGERERDERDVINKTDCFLTFILSPARIKLMSFLEEICIFLDF